MKVRPLDGGLIFVRPERTSKSGQPISRAMLCATLGTACRKAGVKDFHFHDFRHCVATRWATRDKIAPAVAMRALGWASPQMLIRYTNLQEGAVGEAFGTARRFDKGLNTEKARSRHR
jgi:integrase